MRRSTTGSRMESRLFFSNMAGEYKTRLEKYLRNAKPWFDNLSVRETGNKGIDHVANHFHEMASSYYSDALHFYEQKEYANSLAALEYAEGWLDAGCALGIFEKRH